MDKIVLGQKLREMRISSGLKWDFIIQQLCVQYGISIARSTIYGYEHGRNYPDPNILFALCRIYGCEDILSDFGYSAKVGHLDESCEEFVLFEDEYSPENWAMIKNFLSLIPLKSQDDNQ